MSVKNLFNEWKKNTEYTYEEIKFSKNNDNGSDEAKCYYAGYMDRKKETMSKYHNKNYTISGMVTTIYSDGMDKYIIIDDGKRSVPIFVDQSIIDKICEKQKEFSLIKKDLTVSVTYDQFHRVCLFKIGENNDDKEYQCFDMQEDTWLNSIYS